MLSAEYLESRLKSLGEEAKGLESGVREAVAKGETAAEAQVLGLVVAIAHQQLFLAPIHMQHATGHGVKGIERLARRSQARILRLLEAHLVVNSELYRDPFFNSSF